MKLAFWLTGTACTGKSSYAVQLASIHGLKLIHLDDAKSLIRRGNTVVSSIQMLLNPMTNEDIFVVEGRIDVDEYYVNSIKNVLNVMGVKTIYIFINPDYTQFIQQKAKRYLENPEFNDFLTEEKYNKINEGIREKLGQYLEIKKQEDLNQITKFDIDNFRYQKDGFTDVKWKQLKVPCEDKSVLDLGCCACRFDEYSKQDGAIKYTGLDVSKAYLFNENAHYFDLNNLENWQEHSDIVLCISVLHYFKDKDKFIGECARLTDDTFILEMPLLKEGYADSEEFPFVTQEEIEAILSKYFSSIECIGESIDQVNSYRLIYHCKK